MTYLYKFGVKFEDLVGDLGSSYHWALSDLLQDSLAKEDKLLVFLVVLLIATLHGSVFYVSWSSSPKIEIN